MEKEVFLQLIFSAIRLAAIFYCANKANSINRSGWGWGIFAFFLPIFAVIAINFVKPVMKWDKE